MEFKKTTWSNYYTIFFLRRKAKYDSDSQDKTLILTTMGVRLKLKKC